MLPLDYAAHAEYLRGILAPIAERVDGRIDVAAVTARVNELSAAAKALQQRGTASDTKKLDEVLLRASRAIVPSDYTSGDRFSHDPALSQNAYPVLDPIRALAAAPAGSDEAAFLLVSARRACNRLIHTLDEAVAALASV